MLCKNCKSYYIASRDLKPWDHCHHEEKREEKCWCEYSSKLHHVSMYDHKSMTEAKLFPIIYCPVCGKKLDDN